MSSNKGAKLLVELQTSTYLADPQDAIKLLQLVASMQPLEHHFRNAGEEEPACHFKFRESKPYYEDKVKAVTPAMLFAIQMNTDESKES